MADLHRTGVLHGTCEDGLEAALAWADNNIDADSDWQLDWERAMSTLAAAVRELRDDICMVANLQPLDPDEDHDKNLLAIAAQLAALAEMRGRVCGTCRYQTIHQRFDGTRPDEYCDRHIVRLLCSDLGNMCGAWAAKEQP